jgi:hypothetical protein
MLLSWEDRLPRSSLFSLFFLFLCSTPYFHSLSLSISLYLDSDELRWTTLPCVCVCVCVWRCLLCCSFIMMTTIIITV